MNESKQGVLQVIVRRTRTLVQESLQEVSTPKKMEFLAFAGGVVRCPNAEEPCGLRGHHRRKESATPPHGRAWKL